MNPDPYKNFRFRVLWDGNVVPGISRVSALARSTEVLQYRSGGDSHSHLIPGATRHDAVVLERGVTDDRSFEQWASLVGETSLQDFRKNVIIHLLNEAGEPVVTYVVRRCWPSRYQALPDLLAQKHEVAVESLTLENEGWQREP